MKLTAATRGSALAVAQTEAACAFLKQCMPEASFTYQTVTTAGDSDRSTPLYRMPSSGIFAKDVERALLSGEADFAVHSMKDLPSDLPQGLMLLPCGIHEDRRDVLISKDHRKLKDLPEGAVIATGSLRRMACLHRLRSDLKFAGIRGNVETRLRIFREKGYDGMILAAAGLKRLGMENEIDEYLDAADVIPACGQGTIAIEIRCSDQKLFAPVIEKGRTDRDLEAAAAREFLRLSNAGCHSPAGFSCVLHEDTAVIDAMLGCDPYDCRFTHFEIGRAQLHQAAAEAAARLEENR